MKSDVVVIGGGPAGLITALTAQGVYPHKSICLVKEIGDGVIPCAIPYMMRTLADPAKNALGDQPLQNAGVNIVVGKVTSLDTGLRRVQLDSGTSICYERLVLATGAEPTAPPIPGIHRRGVHLVRKSMSSLEDLRGELHEARSVVIVGGGFIGVEFADELSGIPGLEVHLVEIMPRLMTAAFDDEFCDAITTILEAKGIHVTTGSRVLTIDGDEHVESVTLEGGRTIPADLVLVSAGARPASELAARAGIRVVDGGSVWVDDYMRTDVEGVFAVGDCALKRDFFTRRAVPVMLASTATAEARIAGTNLYGIRVMRQIPGTLAAFSTRIGDVAFASAGMTVRTCEAEGFRFIKAVASAPDRHPGALPGASTLTMQLLFSRRSGVLIGGQLSGGPSVGELINVVGLGIQNKVTACELDMMQIATHPLLTPAPTVHPLVNAAHRALAEMRALER
jgi:NADPH-dependent 2,4-dienoyl-CoA reductase/sulfur reductase-like enzyme